MTFKFGREEARTQNTKWGGERGEGKRKRQGETKYEDDEGNKDTNGENDLGKYSTEKGAWVEAIMEKWDTNCKR